MNRFASVTRPLMWFMAFMLAALTAGCGGGGGGAPILGGGGVPAAAAPPAPPAPPAPALPAGTVIPGACVVAGPAVTSSDPTANNLFVPISTASVTPNKLITATFSVPMDLATINSAAPGALSTFTLKDMTASPGTIVSGTVLLDGTNTVATLTTTAALTPNTWYTASITTAAMALPNPPGTPLSCSYAWNFKTAGAGVPPSVGQVNLKTAAPFGLIAWDALTDSSAGKTSHIYGDVALTGGAGVGIIANAVGPGFKDVPGDVAPLLRSTAVTDSLGVTPALITAADNGTPANIAALPQLQVDLNAAYLDLSNATGLRPAPVTPLGSIAAATGAGGGTFPPAAPDLSGYVLSPGIFTTSGTYALSNTLGPLVLDAGGNPDAVFIIRSTGSGISGLTSTTGSVVLQGKAQSKNVFWVVDNATIGDGLGDTPFFQGTVLAGHAITLGKFANVEGRLLAGALFPTVGSGALTIKETNVITVPK